MATMSGRTRTALMRQQNQLSGQVTTLRAADRMLSGALAACDPVTQHEMLSGYLETLQEVRVSLQRLEGFAAKRLDGALHDAGPMPSFAGSLGLD